MKKYNLFIFLFFLSFFSSEKLFSQSNKVVEHQLSNGLKILIAPMPFAQKVSGGIVVKAGSKFDPKEATGIAHYLEHMLFKGTSELGTIDFASEKIYLDKINELYIQLSQTKTPEEKQNIQLEISKQSAIASKFAIPNEMDQMLAAIGGNNINAFTSHDQVFYFNDFPAHQLEKWMSIYAHRFQNPVFRLFQSELETVYEEKNISMDNTNDVVFETFFAHFFKQHPYGQIPILGTVEHLKNPRLDKMYDFYNQYYVANNMALVLAGNIDPNEVIVLAEKYFSKLKTGQPSKNLSITEKDFNGAEVIEVKLTPVKMGVLGFRTIPQTHKDKAAIDVLTELLENSSGSGRLNKLENDGDLISCSVYDFSQVDLGGTAIFYLPKLMGQSFAKAEKLILNSIEKIKNGEFSEDEIEAIKLNMEVELKLDFENSFDCSLSLANSFISDKSWRENEAHFTAFRNVTKADVIRVCKQYFDKNYLAFRSSKGSPKKEMLQKPNFLPLEKSKEAKISSFQKNWNTITTGKPKLKGLNFESDIVQNNKGGMQISYFRNTVNDIFSLEFVFGNGKFYDSNLDILTAYLNNAGTKSKKVNEFKNELYKIACCINFVCEAEKITAHIQGPDKSLEPAILLLKSLMYETEWNAKNIAKIAADKKADLEFNLTDPFFLANVLKEYSFYGAQSTYLKSLNYKQIKKLSVNSLKTSLDSLLQYEVKVNYTGSKDLAELTNILVNKFYDDKEKLKAKENPEIFKKAPLENEILWLNNTKMLQSQMHFQTALKPLKNDDIFPIELFNQYYDGSMAGIISQEIREFRALAYSTSGYVRLPKKLALPSYFSGYVGCQADKTVEAISVMTKLIKEMPSKPEQIEDIKNSLINSLGNENSNFRNNINWVTQMKKYGFRNDPIHEKLSYLNSISFKNIQKFHAENFQNPAIRITLVGNKKAIKSEDLEKFGKIKEVNLKEIINF